MPTATLLDTYSPELFCMIRNFHDAAPKVADAVGGNGYSLAAAGTILGAPNPYVYPDNLPRVNAHGGPGADRAAGRRSPGSCGRHPIW